MKFCVNRKNTFILGMVRHRAIVMKLFTARVSTQSYGTFSQKSFFIALIHPIQWTIAYPVGADRPAKRQKKTSCVSTGRPVPSTSALARWRVVLPSCLDRVTSWHLFRLARARAQALKILHRFLWIILRVDKY